MREKKKVINCEHTDREHHSHGLCKSCASARLKRLNKDKVSKHNSTYYQKHKKRIHAMQKQYRKANPERERARRRKQTYGILPEQWEKMLKAGRGKCWSCGSKDTLCVDHCHDTGKVRGLLCAGCNVGLGCIGDNIEGVINLLKYLTTSEKKIKKIIPEDHVTPIHKKNKKGA